MGGDGRSNKPKNQKSPGASLVQTIDRLTSEKVIDIRKVSRELMQEYKEDYQLSRRWQGILK